MAEEQQQDPKDNQSAPSNVKQAVVGLKGCGIYRIVNNINGLFYIGSSIDIKRRLNKHFNLLRKNKHHSLKLQSAFNKYKEINFTINIIESVYFPSDKSSLYKCEYLECLEQFYLDKYKPYEDGYNISKKANNPVLIRSKESLEKAMNTRKLNNTIVSEETRKKISESLKASDKWKNQHKKMTFKRRVKVYEYDLKGNYLKEWNSVYEVAEVLNLRIKPLMAAVYRDNRRFNESMFKTYKVNKIEEFIPLGKRRRRKNG